MEVALRRRLDGVAGISISQNQQTAEVVFDPTPHRFSPAAFREAAGEADVDVLRFDVDVCGIVEESGDQRFLTAGGDRYLLADGAEPDAGQRVCASGRLDDRSDPPRLALASVQSGGS
jgi:hypothetical protein